MKKFTVTLSVLCLLFAGCTQPVKQIDVDSISPKQQNGLSSINAVPYENGFYYCAVEASELRYAEGLESSFKVADLSYNDDVSSSKKDHFSNYYDMYTGGPFYLYADRIFYLADYATSDGQTACRLYSLQKDGSDRKTVIEFPFEANTFLIHMGKVYVTEFVDAKETQLHVFSTDGKEIKVIQCDGLVNKLFADENSVYLQIASALEGGSFVQLDTETLEMKKIAQGETLVFIYECDGKAALRELNHPIRTDADLEDLESVYRIINLENNEVLMEFQDEDICLFDEQYVYTSFYEEGKAVYRIRDWDGNVVDEIKPSDSLGEQGFYRTLLQDADYSEIIRVIGQSLVFCTYDFETYTTKFGVCDTSKDNRGCRMVEDR